jgi:hypothetical protein
MCQVCLIAISTRHGELGPVDMSTGSSLPGDVLKSEEPAVLLGSHPYRLGEGLRQPASTPPDFPTHVCNCLDGWSCVKGSERVLDNGRDSTAFRSALAPDVCQRSLQDREPFSGRALVTQSIEQQAGPGTPYRCQRYRATVEIQSRALEEFDRAARTKDDAHRTQQGTRINNDVVNSESRNRCRSCGEIEYELKSPVGQHALTTMDRTRAAVMPQALYR